MALVCVCSFSLSICCFRSVLGVELAEQLWRLPLALVGLVAEYGKMHYYYKYLLPSVCLSLIMILCDYGAGRGPRLLRVIDTKRLLKSTIENPIKHPSHSPTYIDVDAAGRLYVLDTRQTATCVLSPAFSATGAHIEVAFERQIGDMPEPCGMAVSQEHRVIMISCMDCGTRSLLILVFSCVLS